MRSWLTTPEVRRMLGGISQPRVSQLVKDGTLVVDYDPTGRIKYDRASVEALAIEKAARNALNGEDRELRKMRQTEARERFARERQRERAAEAERKRKHDDLWERAVHALEKLAQCR